jgi:hypothetical protein
MNSNLGIKNANACPVQVLRSLSGSNVTLKKVTPGALLRSDLGLRRCEPFGFGSLVSMC